MFDIGGGVALDGSHHAHHEAGDCRRSESGPVLCMILSALNWQGAHSNPSRFDHDDGTFLEHRRHCSEVCQQQHGLAHRHFAAWHHETR